MVYHLMFGPGWKEGCPRCSFWADHYDGVNIHIGQRDTAFAVVSRAPLTEIEPFRKRRGWRFKWFSSFKTDFNFDFNVSFSPEQIKRGLRQVRNERQIPGLAKRLLLRLNARQILQ